MKAVRFAQFGAPLRVVDVPDPGPKEGEARVEVAACGLCRSDWHLWQGDWSWVGVSPALPLTIGHEAAGVVRSVGPGVVRVRVGERVTIPFHESCGQCATCISGASNLCPNAAYLGSSHDGAMADFVIVRHADATCIPVPDAVSDVAAATLGCRYMTAFHAATDVGHVARGEWAVVHGCGGLGLALVQILVALGARVVATDVDDAKLAVATSLGAEAVIHADADVSDAVLERTAGGGQLSFDAVGSSVVFEQSITSLARRGRHVQVGLTSADASGVVPLQADLLVFREIRVLGSIGCPLHRLPELIHMVATGELQPEKLVGDRLGLSDVPARITSMGTYATRGMEMMVAS